MIAVTAWAELSSWNKRKPGRFERRGVGRRKKCFVYLQSGVRESGNNNWYTEFRFGRSPATMALVPHGGGAGGSVTMAMPLLTADNYTVWTIKAQAILDVNNVWEAVAPGDAAVNAPKDKMARALLFGALPRMCCCRCRRSSPSGRYGTP